MLLSWSADTRGLWFPPAQTFIRAEDQNFSLFNYVNDLTNEIEKMENATGEVKEEIKKYKGQGAPPLFEI